MTEVTRRDGPVAVLSPPRPAARMCRPDFAARLKAICGSKVLPTTGTEIVAGARGKS